MDNAETPTSFPYKSRTHLLPGWPGCIIAVLMLLVETTEGFAQVASLSNVKALSQGLFPLLFLSGWAYWLFWVHRFHVVLREITSGIYPITPWRAVLYHFIPIYAFVHIFRWPSEAVTFINRALHPTVSPAMNGKWLGALLFSGFFLSIIDVSLGLAVTSVAGLYLNRKLRLVVEDAPQIALAESSVFYRPSSSTGFVDFGVKILALIFVFFLLVIGLAVLLLFGFWELTFDWQDFLVFLVIAAIAYAVVRRVGSALNRRFQRLIQEFLDGKSEQLSVDIGLLRTFGLLMVTLLPLLLYLEFFALYSAVTFSLYVFIAITAIPRVPVALLIGLAIIVIGTAIALVVGLYYLFFPPGRQVLGIEVKANEQPRLWDLVRRVAREVGAKPINKIVISPDPGIGVYLEGSLVRTLLGGGRRVLEVGIPSLNGLTVRELQAILAHEYGHFSNRDTQWARFTYCLGNSLLRALQATPGPPKKGEKSEGIARILISLNPAYWILLLFVELYFRVTSGFSRIGEVLADISAIRLYGGETFSNGLVKVAMNDRVFIQFVQGELVPQLLKEGKGLTHIAAIMTFIYGEFLGAEAVASLRQEIIASPEPIGVYDSHPPLALRMRYATKFGGTEAEDNLPVVTLFDNWDALDEQVSRLYNVRILAWLAAMQTTGSQK